MDPRIASQRKGGLIILVIFILAIGMASGILLATGLDWLPRTSAADTNATLPGQAADVQPSELLLQSQESFRSLVTAVRPAVVSIQAENFDKSNNPPTMQFNPFEMFGIPGPDGQQFFSPQDPHQQQMPEVSAGSGFIVSKDGYILTNNHVVEGATDVKVILDDGTNYDAKIVGSDPETDVAVLKIEGDSEFPYLEFGDVNRLQVGDWVMAVGNPFGNLAGTVTVGIISATGREYLQLPGDTYYQNFIQTDAAINFGNSGGPLVNLSGKVIGINTAISSQGSGIGFATPIDLAQFVYNSFRENGEVIRGWIGVTIQNLDGDLAEAMGLDSNQGSIVAGVNEGEPAAQGGLREGDVILEVGGQKVNSTASASRLIAALPVGEASEFKIWRDNHEMTLEITPSRRAPDEPAAYDENWSGDTSEKENNTPSTNEEFLGLTVRPLTSDDIAQYELPEGSKGVFIESVDPRSNSFEKGLRTGNVIVEINNEAVLNMGDYQRLMAAAKEKWDSEGKTVIIRFLAYGTTTGWIRSFMAIPFD